MGLLIIGPLFLGLTQALVGIHLARQRPDKGLFWFIVPGALAFLMPWLLPALDPWLGIYESHSFQVAPRIDHKFVGPSWQWLLWAYPLGVLILGALLVRSAPGGRASALCFTSAAAMISLAVSLMMILANSAF